MKDDDKEPDWMNPANDRKTPYTNEEIEEFVDGFILGLDDHEWSAMKAELGEDGYSGEACHSFHVKSAT